MPRPHPTHRRLSSRWRVALVAMVLGGTVAPVVLPVSTAHGASALTGGTVSPDNGTTATTFTFTVTFASDPNEAPDAVVAEVAGLTIALTLASGMPEDGTYQGSRTLPAGTWNVVFRARVQGSDPTFTVPGTVTVAGAPTPTPAPSPPPPTPVATATPRPTATPTARPRPTPPRPTPRPTPPPPDVTPRPTPRPTPLPPGSTPAPLPAGVTPAPTPIRLSPTATPEPRTSASSGASGSTAPSDTASPAASDATPGASSPEATAPPRPSATPPGGDPRLAGGFGRAGWVVIGAATAFAGAGVLARQWLRLRR